MLSIGLSDGVWRKNLERFSTGSFILNFIILFGKPGFYTYYVALESNIKDMLYYICIRTLYVPNEAKHEVMSAGTVPCGYRDKCYQPPSSDKLTSALSPH